METTYILNHFFILLVKENDIGRKNDAATRSPDYKLLSRCNVFQETYIVVFKHIVYNLKYSDCSP